MNTRCVGGILLNSLLRLPPLLNTSNNGATLRQKRTGNRESPQDHGLLLLLDVFEITLASLAFGPCQPSTFNPGVGCHISSQSRQFFLSNLASFATVTNASRQPLDPFLEPFAPQVISLHTPSATLPGLLISCVQAYDRLRLSFASVF